MSASGAVPLPRLGEVFFDIRGNARSMRLSWYADTGVAVFSIWQGGICTGTFRLPISDLPRMIETLRNGPGVHQAGETQAAPRRTAAADPQAAARQHVPEDGRADPQRQHAPAEYADRQPPREERQAFPPADYPPDLPATDYQPGRPAGDLPAELPRVGYPPQAPAARYQATQAAYPAEVAAGSYHATQAAGYPAEVPAAGHPAEAPAGSYHATQAAGYPAEVPAVGYPAEVAAGSYHATQAAGHPAEAPVGDYQTGQAASYWPAPPSADDWSAPPAAGQWPATEAADYQTDRPADDYSSGRPVAQRRSTQAAHFPQAPLAGSFPPAAPAVGHRPATQAASYRPATQASAYRPATPATGYLAGQEHPGYQQQPGAHPDGGRHHERADGAGQQDDPDTDSYFDAAPRDYRDGQANGYADHATAADHHTRRADSVAGTAPQGFPSVPSGPGSRATPGGMPDDCRASDQDSRTGVAETYPRVPPAESFPYGSPPDNLELTGQQPDDTRSLYG
jgi:hypothetical protein